MNCPNNGEKPIVVSTRDRVMRAWENSMELTRDFEMYSKEIHDDPAVARVFADFAEEECVHAARFREILHQYQDEG